MAGISKRIFGSELPLAIKEKLKAYENLQDGVRNPNDTISPDSDFTYNDFKLLGYESHPSIKMDMAV